MTHHIYCSMHIATCIFNGFLSTRDLANADCEHT